MFVCFCVFVLFFTKGDRIEPPIIPEEKSFKRKDIMLYERVKVGKCIFPPFCAAE